VKRRLSAAPRASALTVAAVFALGVGLASYLAGAWQRLENDTVDLRFAVRGTEPAPSDVVVVAIDDKTFSDLKQQWPFSRSLHAAVVDRLRADGARAIAYDIQFTEPSHDGRADLDLYRAIGRAGNVVLATTEVDSRGHTNVLGGDANLRPIHAEAAASNLPADPGGVIRRYPYVLIGLKSFAVAAAQLAGHAVGATRFDGSGALIDFRGPPGTIRTVSFSDVVRGRVNPRTFAGKIVVVGASAPTLQDVHPTSTASATPMAGPEIQANAIWSALHDNPLQSVSSWLTIVAVLLCALAAPLASLRFRVLTSALIALVVAAAYVVLTQLAFDSGNVLVLSYPLVAWALGTVAMVTANYVVALIERNAFSRQLQESQLELIQRLAQAVESRDTETGEHIHRIGVLCERLALRVGWTAAEAETLRHASVMHDIGKIGISDRVLLKPGALDAEEWEAIKAHTTIGAQILAGSANPLVRMAETVARCHHERWDGSGYPAGLKGEEIPLAGRICAVVDVYDALLSKRAYKDAWRMQDVLAEIERGSGSQFDPELVAAFLELAPALAQELGASLQRESLLTTSKPATV
jgi:CHASE2 domain-containing sensor protein